MSFHFTAVLVHNKLSTAVPDASTGLPKVKPFPAHAALSRFRLLTNFGGWHTGGAK
jgi:hypothetical protein